MRGVVEEVPHVKEVVAGYAAADTLVQVEQTGRFPAELNGVASDDLGSHIFIAVGPLIQNAADIGPEGLRIDAADLSNAVGGKSNRRLRVVRDFIPAPPSGIGAKLVEEGRREGVVPDDGERIVDLTMMEDVVGTVAVVVVSGQRNPVNGKANAVFTGDIGIKAAVVLDRAKFRRVEGSILREVGYCTQVLRAAAAVAAGAGVLGTGPAGILPQCDIAQRKQGWIQRRAEINALARDGGAVYALGEACIAAVGAANQGSDYAVAGEGKILSRDAAGRRQGVERRCVVPTGARQGGVRFTDGFVVEEGENLILPDGAADAAAELIELIIVSELGTDWLAEVRLECVQVRLVGGEEEAAMEVIGAAL